MAKVFGFLKGKKIDVEITLDGVGERRLFKTPSGETAPLFMGDETLSGSITVATKKPFEHNGLVISLIGQVEMRANKNQSIIFVNESNELPAGVIDGDARYPFNFAGVEKKHESYTGSNASVRYFVRMTVLQKYGDVVKEMDVWINNFDTPPAGDTMKGLKMEVGISECLHIEIEYLTTTHHLRDVIIGKVFFLLSRIKVKHMALSLVRRETVAVGADHLSERKILAKYQLMDGEPVRGECIPIRMFLGAYDELTPTYAKVEAKLSVRYYLSLGIIDSDDRRYFKQHELNLWRSPEEANMRTLGVFKDCLDLTGKD